ncbi:MAG: hypothetical protein KGJ06_07980 [Pseudomonadota bacterium]|nr:hypothetical protein [Pseudomonadota bacterium]
MDSPINLSDRAIELLYRLSGHLEIIQKADYQMIRDTAAEAFAALEEKRTVRKGAAIAFYYQEALQAESMKRDADLLSGRSRPEHMEKLVDPITRINNLLNYKDVFPSCEV